MSRRLPVVLAVAAGLALAACGSRSPDDAGPGSTPATTSTIRPADVTPSSEPVDGGSAVAPVDVPPALQFSAPLLGGGDIELTTLAGRPVLLWFWAPW